MTPPGGKLQASHTMPVGRAALAVGIAGGGLRQDACPAAWPRPETAQPALCQRHGACAAAGFAIRRNATMLFPWHALRPTPLMIMFTCCRRRRSSILRRTLPLQHGDRSIAAFSLVQLLAQRIELGAVPGVRTPWQRRVATWKHMIG